MIISDDNDIADDATVILDARNAKAFSAIAFSGCTKTSAMHELNDSLLHFKFEAACYWSADLLCAGHGASIWETCIRFFTRYIHTANVKLVVYLNEQLQAYKSMIAGDATSSSSLLFLRNNVDARALFGHVLCVIIESKRGRICREIKVDVHDLHLPTLINSDEVEKHFLAPNRTFAEAIFHEEDPPELFVAINELVYAITPDGANCMQGWYWIEWILSYIQVRHGHTPPLAGIRRQWATTQLSMQTNPIWLVWDGLLKEARRRGGIFTRLIESAHGLFSFNVKRGDLKKRRGLLYFSVEVLTEPFSCDVVIMKHKEKLDTISAVIDHVYGQLKEEEVLVVSKGVWG